MTSYSPKRSALVATASIVLLAAAGLAGCADDSNGLLGGSTSGTTGGTSSGTTGGTTSGNTGGTTSGTTGGTTSGTTGGTTSGSTTGSFGGIVCNPAASTYRPIQGATASTSSGSNGICLGCGVTNPNNVIDDTLSTFAVMSTPVGVAGNTFLGVQDSVTTYPANHRVGFVLADPSGSLLTLNLLQSATVTTFNSAGDIDNSTANATLALDLLGTPVIGINPTAVFLSLKSSAPFIGVRLNYGSVVGALATLNVYQACVSADPVP